MLCYTAHAVLMLVYHPPLTVRAPCRDAVALSDVHVGQPAMSGCTPSRSPLKTGCPAKVHKDTGLSVGRWYQALAHISVLCPSYPSSVNRN